MLIDNSYIRARAHTTCIYTYTFICAVNYQKLNRLALLRTRVRARDCYKKGGEYNYGEYDFMPRMSQDLQDRERA
jgi:hypothetical protein